VSRQLFIGIAAIGLALQAQPGSFNLGTDFSLSDNPGKIWQYGYSASASLAPEQFRLYSYADTSGPIGFWHPAKSEGNGPGYYPYAAFNTTGKSRPDSSNGWAVRGGEVAMEGSNTGQYSLVRFTAPRAGVYRVEGVFEGLHFRLSSTDVHVLHNAISVFDAKIEGYGGDPAFHRIEGAAPSSAFSALLELKARDTVTFAVGYGKNKTHYNDTTGLIARITLVQARSASGQKWSDRGK
jgi:hypothetical protein